MRKRKWPALIDPQAESYLLLLLVAVRGHKVLVVLLLDALLLVLVLGSTGVAAAVHVDSMRFTLNFAPRKRWLSLWGKKLQRV